MCPNRIFLSRSCTPKVLVGDVEGFDDLSSKHNPCRPKPFSLQFPPPAPGARACPSPWGGIRGPPHHACTRGPAASGGRPRAGERCVGRCPLIRHGILASQFSSSARSRRLVSETSSTPHCALQCEILLPATPCRHLTPETRASLRALPRSATSAADPKCRPPLLCSPLTEHHEL